MAFRFVGYVIGITTLKKSAVVKHPSHPFFLLKKISVLVIKICPLI